MKNKLNEADEYLLYLLAIYGGKKNGRKNK